MFQWRKIVFWCLVIIAVVLFTDPIIGIQNILGYGQFLLDNVPTFYMHFNAMDFGDTRYGFRSILLIATLIVLGAWTSRYWSRLGCYRYGRLLGTPGLMISVASVFRAAEVLTDMLISEGVCLGSRQACLNNTVIEFWEGDRFTIIAYLALGTAVVIGGALARKGWKRFVAPPPSPVMPATASAAVAAEELPAPERASENPAQGPTLATTPAIA